MPTSGHWSRPVSLIWWLRVAQTHQFEVWGSQRSLTTQLRGLVQPVRGGHAICNIRGPQNLGADTPNYVNQYKPIFRFSHLWRPLHDVRENVHFNGNVPNCIVSTGSWFGEIFTLSARYSQHSVMNAPACHAHTCTVSLPA